MKKLVRELMDAENDAGQHGHTDARHARIIAATEAVLAAYQLKVIVFSNLNDALANDYDVRTWTAADIAADLVAFAADCEDYDPEELAPHIETWLKEHAQ